MSFLSNAVTKRRLALFCVRLVIQYVMMCSIQQVGMDEIDVKGIRVADAASARSIACNDGAAGSYVAGWATAR